LGRKPFLFPKKAPLREPPEKGKYLLFNGKKQGFKPPREFDKSHTEHGEDKKIVSTHPF